MVLSRMVQGGCRKRMPEAGLDSPLCQDVGSRPWGSGPTASSRIFCSFHLRLCFPSGSHPSLGLLVLHSSRILLFF